ncbi:MAG: VWA domain-containing protein [Clostridia bacterium]|nr:VWA domain-containing protein [Clostridia bacterium]
MTNIDVVVQRPWLFLILVPALLLGIIPFLRLNRKRRASTKHLIPFIVHLTLIFLLSGLLAGVTVVETTDEPLETKIVFVADVSESNIHTKDEMNRFIKETIAHSDKERTVFSLVLFANNIVKIVDESSFDMNASDYLLYNPEGVQTNQTNIEDAIETAQELFVKTKQIKKMVIMSDGLETIGDGISASKHLENGIQLSGAYFNTVAENTQNREVQLVSINTQSRVAEGGEVSVEVVVQSTRLVRNAKLVIYDGDIVTPTMVQLEQGRNVFKVTYKPEVAGINTIKAELELPEGSDLIAGNNVLYSWYSLDAQKTILVVDGDKGKSEEEQFGQISSCASILDRLKEYKIIGPIAPNQFPNHLEDLLEYDEVVLMDVNFADLPATAGKNLERYVKEVGRGLFVSFGDNLYDVTEDMYRDTPIASILPVELALSEEKETIAMVLVIDLSSSMNAVDNGKSRFDTVVESTKRVLMLGANEEDKLEKKGFGDSDYLGIVVFDQDSHVALDMQQLGDYNNRMKIAEKVEYELRHFYYAYYLNKDGTESDIVINEKNDGKVGVDNKYEKEGYTVPEGYNNGGTDKLTGDSIKTKGTSYKWAIQAASDMLSKKNNETRLHIKQVILMSDGAPNDKGSGYDGIVERMAKTGTVTSAIAIGGDVLSDGGIAELSKIAEKGKGELIYAKTGDELTTELVQKAEEVTGELLNEQPVTPSYLSLKSSVLQGLVEYDYAFDTVGGYYSSSIKENASLVLYVDQLKPLYAEWDCGLGKVSVFMSDLGRSDWSKSMYSSEVGTRLISNMLVATMNRQVDSTGLDPSASRQEEMTTVVVNTPVEIIDGEILVAQVTQQDGTVSPNLYRFDPIAAKKYRAIIPTYNTEETYTIKLMLREEKTGKINDTTTFAVTGYYNEEYNVFGDGGEETLVGMTNNADGDIVNTPGDIFGEVTSEIRVFNHDIDTPLAVVALLLFVVDIIFRNIVVKRKKEKVEMTDEEQAASMRGR